MPRIKLLRIVFVVVCTVLLACGFLVESHETTSLAQKDKDPGVADRVPVSGLDFTDGATAGSFLREEEVLYDVYGLTPVSVQENAKIDAEKT